MLKNGNLYLIGLMGTGKTTLGRHLARVLGCPFMDSDHELEKRTGVCIPVIFEHEGEAGFRRREENMIRELTGLRGIVLATGGGAVLSANNRRQLKDNGTVVYLRADPVQLLERTRLDRNRPLLQTADPLGRLRELQAARAPLYEEIADVTLDTGRQNLNQLLAQLGPLLAKPAV